jgi:hypothetical protein
MSHSTRSTAVEVKYTAVLIFILVFVNHVHTTRVLVHTKTAVIYYNILEYYTLLVDLIKLDNEEPKSR